MRPFITLEAVATVTLWSPHTKTFSDGTWMYMFWGCILVTKRTRYKVRCQVFCLKGPSCSRDSLSCFGNHVASATFMCQITAYVKLREKKSQTWLNTINELVRLAWIKHAILNSVSDLAFRGTLVQIADYYFVTEDYLMTKWWFTIKSHLLIILWVLKLR